MKTATELAQQIADRELDACCEWLCNKDILEPAWARSLIDAYRAARRPKPPSLAEQALDAMRSIQIKPCIINGITVNAELISKYNTMYNTIRRALERLQELEDGNG